MSKSKSKDPLEKEYDTLFKDIKKMNNDLIALIKKKGDISDQTDIGIIIKIKNSYKIKIKTKGEELINKYDDPIDADKIKKKNSIVESLKELEDKINGIYLRTPSGTCDEAEKAHKERIKERIKAEESLLKDELLLKFNRLLEKEGYLNFVKLNYRDTYRQIEENIGKHDDYIKKIDEIIKDVNISDKTLIVDYANLTHFIENNEFQERTFSSNIIDNSKEYDLISNRKIDKNFQYNTKAIFLILNYSLKNNFKNIFIVSKVKVINKKLLVNIKSFIETNYIGIDQKKYLENVRNLNIYILHVELFEFPERRDISEVQTNFIHKMKGNDDAVIAILSNEIIKKNKSINVEILTRDRNLFNEFIVDQQFIPSFKLTIERLDTELNVQSSDFYINFMNKPYFIDRSLLSQLNSSIFLYGKEILDYIYTKSKLDKDGNYNVNNFYKYSSTNESIENISFDKLPDITNNFVKYVDEKTNKPTLNKYNMPFLYHNGHIATLISHINIPYVSIIEKYKEYTENTLKKRNLIEVIFIPARQSRNAGIAYMDSPPYQNRIKTFRYYDKESKQIKFMQYCSLRSSGAYTPNLQSDQKPYTYKGKICRIDIETKINVDKSTEITCVPYCYWANGSYHPTLNFDRTGDYYRNQVGDIDEIIIEDWQPWYNKYIKYKQKYQLLKKKLLEYK